MVVQIFMHRKEFVQKFRGSPGKAVELNLSDKNGGPLALL
jgi:hypothetical protein